MARELGVSRTRYVNWENGPYGPNPDIQPKLTERLDDLERMHSGGLARLKGQAQGKLKMFGNVGAGSEPYHGDSEGEMDVPIEFAAEDFGGLVCEGDSMLPYLHPGDTLVFLNCTQARLNKLFAVRPTKGGYPLVKRLVYEDGKWLLRSFNVRHKDLPLEDYTLLGYLAGFISGDGHIKVGPIRDGITETFLLERFQTRIA